MSKSESSALEGVFYYDGFIGSVIIKSTAVVVLNIKKKNSISSFNSEPQFSVIVAMTWLTAAYVSHIYS